MIISKSAAVAASAFSEMLQFSTRVIHEVAVHGKVEVELHGLFDRGRLSIEKKLDVAVKESEGRFSRETSQMLRKGATDSPPKP